jgi:hypothetical protein
VALRLTQDHKPSTCTEDVERLATLNPPGFVKDDRVNGVLDCSICSGVGFSFGYGFGFGFGFGLGLGLVLGFVFSFDFGFGCGFGFVLFWMRF